MSQAAHSPLPFGEPMLQDESGVYQVRDANGQRTACVYSACDAAFVRQACNSHEELLAALKRALKTIRAWHDMGSYDNESYRALAWKLYQESPEMKAINAAIALAEAL